MKLEKLYLKVKMIVGEEEFMRMTIENREKIRF